MRPLKIECADGNWKILLKRNLQEGMEVDLLDPDYVADGPFCEILAMSHSMTLRLDTRKKAALFRKIRPAHGANLHVLPSPDSK